MPLDAHRRTGFDKIGFTVRQPVGFVAISPFNYPGPAGDAHARPGGSRRECGDVEAGPHDPADRVGFGALGMSLPADDPVLPPPAGIRCDTLAELVSRSDVVTLHLPLVPETHHPINAKTLPLMKPGAILVNCGRGHLIDNDAACQALTDGRIGGIGLDGFDPESPAHHPLFDHPDVVLTPHLMGLSRQATAGGAVCRIS